MSFLSLDITSRSVAKPRRRSRHRTPVRPGRLSLYSLIAGTSDNLCFFCRLKWFLAHTPTVSFLYYKVQKAETNRVVGSELQKFYKILRNKQVFLCKHLLDNFSAILLDLFFSIARSQYLFKNEFIMFIKYKLSVTPKIQCIRKNCGIVYVREPDLD